MRSRDDDAPESQRRRVSPGVVELRGAVYWNRYREESVDTQTGVILRRSVRMRLGKFRSQSAAEDALKRYLALLSPETLTPGRGVTAREYFARFDRLSIALMRSESQRAYRGTIRRYLEPAFGGEPLAAIDATAVQELIADLHARELARSTIAGVRDRCLEILRHARAAGFAAHAIERRALKLPSPTHPEVEQRYIGPADLERLIKGSLWPQRALWALLGFTGLRIAEALALTWPHVDLRARVVHVRRGCVAGALAPLKTTRSRRDVPILPQLHDVLSQFRAVSAPNELQLLFASTRGRPLRADDVRRRWLAPTFRRLGLARIGFHGFRHGLPRMLDALGLSSAAIQLWMGHANLSMTERYLHHSTEDLRAQLDRVLSTLEDAP